MSPQRKEVRDRLRGDRRSGQRTAAVAPEGTGGHLQAQSQKVLHYSLRQNDIYQNIPCIVGTVVSVAAY